MVYWQITKNLVEADKGRATILIGCSDDVYVTALMGRDDGFSYLPHSEVVGSKK